ncbi:hypothetical protein V6N11_012531 [Hibiscus sabdariffa]|uniref:Retrotransposon gag domain-containing protein n=1 Tax=Hibiscus sabdariffa TaxID=183260 RepID=A0ABR2QBS1_9ROSI
MTEEDQTIRELAAAPYSQQPLCITFPNGEVPFSLKTGLIHLLPTFHGLPNENPHKRLKEFHMDCLSTKPHEVLDDQIKLRAFPFSLSDLAKDWFFPAAKASELRRNILGIQKKESKSLYDYWERFKKKCANCPQHGMMEQTLLQYFYEGLTPMEMKMIDAASEGALVDLTPTAAKNLISTMAANSQQFRPSSEPSREFTRKQGKARLCRICTMSYHSTDCCPILQEDAPAQINTVGSFPGPPQRPYNPYGNTYNLGWNDHPNFSYAQNQSPNQAYQPRSTQQQSYQQPQKSSLESMMEKFIASQEKFQRLKRIFRN